MTLIQWVTACAAICGIIAAILRFIATHIAVKYNPNNYKNWEGASQVDAKGNDIVKTNEKRGKYNKWAARIGICAAMLTAIAVGMKIR